MLEEMLGYAASGAIGMAGAGLVLLNRGIYHLDKERGVHVANEKSLSARIIRHFPNYRHISSPLDHFIEGIAQPYAMSGLIGFTLAAQRYFGLNVEPEILRPELVYAQGWAFSVIAQVGLQLYSIARQRRMWDLNDWAQLTADASSSVASGALVANRLWI